MKEFTKKRPDGIVLKKMFDENNKKLMSEVKAIGWKPVKVIQKKKKTSKEKDDK
tara:strand:- start:586 stop:747 length:162 start_codon:yes stop_codon:yes gene_type:complete